VGEILQLLKNLGIDDNTLFFFSGDKGAYDYFKSEEHPRGIHFGNKDPNSTLENAGQKESCMRVDFGFRSSPASQEKFRREARMN